MNPCWGAGKGMDYEYAERDVKRKGRGLTPALCEYMSL